MKASASNYWPWAVAVASCLALIFSGAPMLVFTQSLFLGPMAADLGWSGAQYYAPLALAGLISAVATPYIGSLADAMGVRRILIPAIVLYSLCYAALGAIGSSLTIYMLLIVALWILQGAHGVLLYSKAVLLSPSSKAGSRLAIALSGTALGGILVPILVDALISAQGWRGTRLTLALMTMVVCLPLAWIFTRPPADLELAGANHVAPTPAAGERGGVNVLASRTFWLILLTIGFSGMAVNSILISIVPILTAKGLSHQWAAMGISIIAGAQLTGRFCTGMLLDIVKSPKIGIPMLMSALMGVAVMLTIASPALSMFALVLLGMGLGAEMELAAYFVRRYFGAAVFARTYGYILGAYTITATSGPTILALSHEASGSYTMGLLGCGILLAVSVGFLAALPPYPDEPLSPDMSRENLKRAADGRDGDHERDFGGAYR